MLFMAWLTPLHSGNRTTRDILERCEKSHAFRSARRGNRKICARSSGMRHRVCIPADPISSVENCQRGTMKIRPVPDVCMYVLWPERSIRGEVEKKTGLPRVFASARSIKTFFVLLWGSACYTAPLVGLTGKEVFICGGKRIVRAEHPSRGAA